MGAELERFHRVKGRVRRGPRPLGVRLLIGYFVLFGFLAALLVVALPMVDADFVGPYPSAGLPILMLNSLAFLVTGILLLNTAKGWWVAAFLITIGVLEELARWGALLGGATVAAWLPWWLSAEQASIGRSALNAAIVLIALRADVRRFYGIGRADAPEEPGEVHADVS